MTFGRFPRNEIVKDLTRHRGLLGGIFEAKSDSPRLGVGENTGPQQSPKRPSLHSSAALGFVKITKVQVR